MRSPDLSMRERVAVDLDGVIFDTMGAFLKIYNENHGTYFIKSQHYKWEIDEILGCTKQEMWKTFDSIQIKDLNLVDYNCPTIISKLKRFYGMDIVTARDKKDKGDLEKRLGELGVKYDQLIIVDKLNYTSKETLARAYSYFIDDSPHQAKALSETRETQVLLYDCPYNRLEVFNDGVRRVMDWTDIWNALMLDFQYSSMVEFCMEERNGK